MINYRKICNQLISELSDVIEVAKKAIDRAEEQILAEDDGDMDA